MSWLLAPERRANFYVKNPRRRNVLEEIAEPLECSIKRVPTPEKKAAVRAAVEIATGVKEIRAN
jgi:hypothetical protein